MPIRGSGRVGQFVAVPAVEYTEIEIDRIDVNGDSGLGWRQQPFRIDRDNRVAVINVRAISAAFISLGSARQVVTANSNFFHDAATRAEADFVEACPIRKGARPLTIVDSRIQGTRYHNLRTSSAAQAGELLYVARSVTVANAQARTVWMWNNLDHGP